MISGEFINKIKIAIDELQKGNFVLVFDNDNREGETDFLIASQYITPESVRTMRKDGGGLIFQMTSYEIAKKISIPFLSDMFLDVSNQYPILKELIADDIPYDTKSSFSLYINHRDTFTGITDNDRSLTMKKFAETVEKIKNSNNKKAMKEFGKNFRTPGHVPICIASEGLLKNRKGHTELLISLVKMAGLIPAASGCEMMSNTGKALSKSDAKLYAKRHNLIFLEGKDIIEAWEKWSK